MPARRAGVQQRSRGGKHVLYAEAGDLCALNETALALWEICDGRTTPEEMVDAICAVCKVDRATVLGDVDHTLGDLTAAGLIEWSREAAHDPRPQLP